MKFEQVFRFFDKKDKEIVKGHESTGWIQWKGTNVCIDIHCKCGHHSHFDGDFMYYFRCPSCDTLYHPQTTIAMVPVEGEYRQYVEKNDNCIKTVGMEE